MGYRPRIGSPRSSGPRHGVLRRAKAKGKVPEQKQRSSDSHASEEEHVPTLEEVADMTLNRLRGLGNQRFALPPFSEYFGLWLRNLREVLSEFEGSPTKIVDEQFVKERSQIFTRVEGELEERRLNEASSEEAIKDLSDNRTLLKRIEEEYATKMREIEERKDSEVKRLTDNIDGIRGERDRIARMKTGIFGAISKKARAQKEAEANQRLNSARRKLELTVQRFTAEQERLRDEYERRKQPVIVHIRDLQKEIENREIDGSLEARRAACEDLINAVNALLQRKRASPH